MSFNLAEALSKARRKLHAVIDHAYWRTVRATQAEVLIALQPYCNP